MQTQEFVGKLWRLCDVLRDDGIVYHEYVTELTYLLFLKLLKERGKEALIPQSYRWDTLVALQGAELMQHYRNLLIDLGSTVASKYVRQIYAHAATRIDRPNNLEQMIRAIDAIDWYSANEEGLGNLYEGLLEKNAGEKKSGAGQYFTPRLLIDVIVKLVSPRPGETCNDPAAGTFGFMVAASNYVRSQTDSYQDLSEQQIEFQRDQAFSGCELVQETHRLALMNALLHGIEGPITQGDSLTRVENKSQQQYDVILTNPPFGTKKGGKMPRTDSSYVTSNKPFQFLQLIVNSLKLNKTARAAVVVPDHVLFQDGEGTRIREELMDKCNLHTILRLPTGIFYAQGVKTNVLFFNQGLETTGNTKEVWFYDLRSDMPRFGKRTPLTAAHFEPFITAYTSSDRSKIIDARWQVITRDDIRSLGNRLDLGLLTDNVSTPTQDPIPQLINTTEEAVNKLQQAALRMSTISQYLSSIDMHTNHHIPDHWRLASWGDVGAFHHGSAFPRSFQGDTTGSISFYKVGSLSEAGGDGFLPTAKDTLTEEARAELRVPLVPAHAVLFAKIGEAIKLNRRALLRTPACIDNNLMAFSCNPTYVHHRFVYYWSMTIDFYELSQASAVPSIRKMSLANLSIPIPPLDEQRVIIKQIESLLRNIQFASQAIYDVNALFTHKIQKQNIFHPYGTLTDRILRLALQGRLTHAILERN